MFSILVQQAPGAVEEARSASIPLALHTCGLLDRRSGGFPPLSVLQCFTTRVLSDESYRAVGPGGGGVRTRTVFHGQVSSHVRCAFGDSPLGPTRPAPGTKMHRLRLFILGYVEVSDEQMKQGLSSVLENLSWKTTVMAIKLWSLKTGGL